jgi:3D (Asp-Asp-Asp) domain-containing protein
MADGDCTSDLFYIDFIPSLSYSHIDENSIHSVCLSFTHPNPADLRINLVATVGDDWGWLELVAAGDIPPGANVDMACFTRDATKSISTGTAPFTGEWKPNENFTTDGFILDNAVVNDYWYLSAWDCDGNGQTGTIDYFELTFFNGEDHTIYTWSNSETTEDIDTLCPGSYTVTVTDNKECFATHETMVGCSTGTENRLDRQMKIFQVSPGILQIDTEVQIESLDVYGMNGKCIIQGKPGGNSIDLSKESAGLYIVRVNTAEGSIVRKVLLQD